MKYNELRQTHSDLATDLDDNNGAFHFSQPLGTIHINVLCTVSES